MQVDNIHLLGAQSTFLVHAYLDLLYLLPATLQGVFRCLLRDTVLLSHYQ